MEQLRECIPRIDNDDDGYDSPPENWDDECNKYADFLDHRRMWAAVMTELGMIRPLARVEKEMLHACNARGEQRMSLARLDKEALARLPRSDRSDTQKALRPEVKVTLPTGRFFGLVIPAL